MLVLPGCLTITWQRTRSQHAPRIAALEGLSSPGASLEECLRTLGAPLVVQEDRVDGLVLIYAAENGRSFGVSGSIPLGDRSASLSYTGVRESARGVALWFDPDWRLLRWQRGRFADLLATVRRHPAPVQEIEEGSGRD